MTRRIQELNIKDFMGIREINHIPVTDFTEIRGGNGEGKTSFTTALEIILGNREAAKNIKNPVRNGQKKATVSAELTDMIITKTWNESGKSRVEIISKDATMGNAKFSNPVEMLERLFGKLPYDPSKLLDRTDKEMIEIYLSLIDTEVDFDELEAQKKATYGERTVINRQKKDAEVKRNSHSLDYPNAPDTEISIAELSTKLTDALAIEEQHRIDMGTRKLNRESIESKKAEIERLNDEINHIMKTDDELLVSMNDYVDPETQSIRDKIETAEDINKTIRYMQEKAKLVSEYKVLRDKSDSLTAELKDIESTKEYEINKAKIPVDGISFGDGGLTYKGVPISQCSTAERLKVALGISVGTHPATNGIKVMLIQHGNNLDKKSLDYVKKFCTENGYQTYIEIVADEPTGTGIFIEAGEIK